MKRIIVVLSLALICMQAEAKKVKMTVDMRGLPKNITGIHVFGDFQAAAGFAGGDWIPGSTLMTQELADTNLYTVVFDAPAFHLYMYQFINGDQSYEVEFVPIESRVLYQNIDYRWFYLDSLNSDTTVLAPVRFGRNAPQDKYLLRYRVDMQNISGGVSSKGVHAADTLNSWNATTQRMYSFDGKVYEYITYIDSTPASMMHYIYADGNTNSDYEVLENGCGVNGIREIVIAKDSMLPVVCYTACSACVPNGVTNLASESFSVSPNPTSGVLQISNSSSIEKIEIRDLLGRVLLTQAYSATNQASIDLSSFSNGILIVEVYDKLGMITAKRIVKE
jgi:alpha-amylase